MRRVLCVHLPYLSIERDRAIEKNRATRCGQSGSPRGGDVGVGGGDGGDGGGGDASVGVAIVVSGSGGLRVVRCDRVAVRRGVRTGQTLAEACAIAPGLATREDDPDADRAAMEEIARWADIFSPVVQIEGDDSLLIDVTGCQRLFGGEEKIIERARSGLAERGYTARMAIADTPGAAWALAFARAGRVPDGVVIAPSGQVAAALGPLPVWSLRIDEGVVDRLRGVGVETVEALLHLPRASVAKRFGGAVLSRLDETLGDAPELLTPFRRREVVRAHVRFTGATDRLDVLREGVAHGLAQFCAALERTVRGARQVLLAFHCPARKQPVIAIDLARATRDADRLRSLFEVRLTAVKLTDKVSALTIWTNETEALDGVQRTLFGADPADEGALGDLLERLTVRLGAEAVVHAAPIDDHLPERAYGYAAAIEDRRSKIQDQKMKNGERRSKIQDRRSKIEKRQSKIENPRSKIRSSRGARSSTSKTETAPDFERPEISAHPVRPMRLFSRPIQAAVLAVVPDGPPIHFRFDGAEHRVVRWAGPERVETGWWRGRHVQRDYFRVESDMGWHYWLFRDRSTGTWFVHGAFD